VEAALNMASLNSKDVLIDLGSGDGRVILAAARRGARAIGFDIDAHLVETSRHNAVAQGLADRAHFEMQDFLQADVHFATVVFAYLSRDGIEKVRQQVVPNLRSGTRLVSLTYDLPGWLPTKTAYVKDAHGVQYILYLWVVSSDNLRHESH
jgi:ribosomal protein L11 methylase PrmA